MFHEKFCDSTSICVDGTACLEGSCVGLTITFACDERDMDADFCSSFLAAGYYEAGDIGCSPSSPCASYSRINKKMNDLYNLNLADVIIELISLVIVVVHMWTRNPVVHRFEIHVMKAWDLILQFSVITLSFSGKLNDDIQNLFKARCWEKGSNAQIDVNGVIDGLKGVKVLGAEELIVGLIAFGASHWSLRENRDKVKQIDSKAFLVSVVMLFFDGVLSSLDFFYFTIEGYSSFSSLSESVLEHQTKETNSAYPVCVLYDEIYTPIRAVATDNCLELVVGEYVAPLDPWEVCIIVMSSIWIVYMCGVGFSGSNIVHQS